MNALFLMVQGVNGNLFVKNENVRIEVPIRTMDAEIAGFNKFFVKKDELDSKALQLISVGHDNNGNFVIKARMKGDSSKYGARPNW